jgi:hypothetical protein
LGEFATGESEAACYRDARSVETKLSATVAKYGSEPVPEIDWSSWEKKIAHKEMVRSLREFYESQMRAFQTPLASPSAISDTVGDWSLFDSARRGCDASVQASEEILRNGARALWISANNPPASLATQSEWLDSDQYWSAFVEKHMHYGNYLNTSVDPEAKETIANEEAGLLKAWQIYDGRNVARMNNKLLYQRPSYEFYDIYRSPLMEHMTYFLARHGHDFRFFPETMHYRDFAEIYRHKWRVLETLHARRAAFQRATLAMDVPLELGPEDGDLDHAGDKFYEDFIHKHNTLTEISVSRLMGNYVFLSDAIPIASESALLRVRRNFQTAGTFFDLGDDVSVLFFKPQTAADADANAEVCPKEAWTNFMRHCRLTGRAVAPGEAELLGVFHDLLAARKEGHEGRWFRASDESTAEAFMRRLRRDDPTREIFEKYVEELQTRWSQAKPIGDAEVEMMVKTKATRYAAETREFETAVMGLAENLQTEVREKTSEAEKKAGGQMVIVDEEGKVSQEGDEGQREILKKAMTGFEQEKEKIGQFLNSLKK